MARMVDQLKSKDLKELVSNLTATAQWEVFNDYLRDLYWIGYQELRDAKTWEESCEIRGGLKALENIFDFPKILRDLAKQKEEEQDNA